MTHTQRRTHVVTWLILTPLLVMLMIAAWQAARSHATAAPPELTAPEAAP